MHFDRVDLIFCALVLTIALLIPMQGAAQEQREIPLSDGISLYIPQEYAVENERGPDFSLRYVRNDSRVILGVYLGNAAEVGANLGERMAIGGCSAFSRITDDNGNRGRDVFVSLRNRFPAQVHFFYRSLSPEQAEASNRIIDSFRLRDASMCVVER